MKVLGLCGGSGSGKGGVSRSFARYGVPSVDTDAVYHDIISRPSPCTAELAARYGREIINENGSLSRAALSRIVFEDSVALTDLNKITHKHILATVREIIRENVALGVDMILIDAPLLFESGFDKECDAIIAVVSEESLRVKRIMERDSIGKEAALKRISAQLSDEYISARADFVIVNSGDFSAIDSRVDEIFSELNK